MQVTGLIQISVQNIFCQRKRVREDYHGFMPEKFLKITFSCLARGDIEPRKQITVALQDQNLISCLVTCWVFCRSKQRKLVAMDGISYVMALEHLTNLSSTN